MKIAMVISQAQPVRANAFVGGKGGLEREIRPLIAAAGALTFASGLVVASRMSETLARGKAQGGDG